MTKSELIALLSAKQPQLDYRDVELAVKELLEQMSAALAVGSASRYAVSAVSRCITGRRAWAGIPRPAIRSRYRTNMCRISSRARNCGSGSIFDGCLHCMMAGPSV